MDFHETWHYHHTIADYPVSINLIFYVNNLMHSNFVLMGFVDA